MLASCDKGPDPLDVDALGALLGADRRISFTRFRMSGTANIWADGTFEVNIPALGTDTGHWWLDGNMICSRWNQVRRGQDLCAFVAKTENGYVGLSANGKATLGTFQILK